MRVNIIDNQRDCIVTFSDGEKMRLKVAVPDTRWVEVAEKKVKDDLNKLMQKVQLKKRKITNVHLLRR